MAVLPASVSPVVHAAESAPAASAAVQPVELARVRYRQGVEAYRGGRYRESIDYFLEADRLSPSAALSFNIARAYENIDDPAAALRWYRDYLRRDPNAKDRADVEGRIRAFEARLVEKGVQQVTVLSTPAGATVLVDGNPVGVTPWTSEIPPGPHRLELRRDGYGPAEQSLDLPADHATEVTVTLTAPAQAPVSTAPTPTSAVEKPAPAAPGPPPPNAEAPSSGPPFTTLGWIGIGVGGAALSGGLAFELLRRGAESDAKSDKTQVGYADHLSTMEGRQTAARVLVGVGAAFAVAGGVLLWVGRDQGRENAPHVSAACVPGACWSTVRGRF